jgi:hypothetical protein
VSPVEIGVEAVKEWAYGVPSAADEGGEPGEEAVAFGLGGLGGLAFAEETAFDLDEGDGVLVDKDGDVEACATITGARSEADIGAGIMAIPPEHSQEFGLDLGLGRVAGIGNREGWRLGLSLFGCHAGLRAAVFPTRQPDFTTVGLASMRVSRNGGGWDWPSW